MSSTPTYEPSLSPPTTSPSRRKTVRYAKALGYLLDPSLVNKQAIEDGTAIPGQFGRTFAVYRNRLAKHCGIKYDDVITVRNPCPDMPPIVGTTEEPRWYYIVRE